MNATMSARANIARDRNRGGARISIVTSGPLCANPRALKEAGALAEAGYNVTVFSIARNERLEANDAALLGAARFRKIAIDRMPGRPVIRAVSLFERTLSWIARRTRTAHPMALGPWHALLRLVKRHPADLAIVHTELPLCVGRRLMAGGLAVAADFEDWHSRDLLPAAQATRPLGLLASVERHHLQHARYVSTTSDSLAEALHQEYGGERPVVIPNVFSLQPSPPLLPRNHPPSFLWFSQTIGPGRGLEEFLRAWDLMRQPSSVTLIGHVEPAYADTLRAQVRSGRGERIHFQAKVPPEALPGVIARHDVGLALEASRPDSRNLTISNKMFQYLNAGLAIVATPTAGQCEVWRHARGIGIMDDLSEPTRLAARLDELVTAPAMLAQMGAAARAAAEREYCWERFSGRLMNAVQRALAG